MKFRLLVAAVLLALPATAHAQTAGFYVYKDTAANIFNMKIWQTGTNPILTTPSSVSSDAFGQPLSGAAGTTNPTNRALYVQGATGGIPLHMICDSGCGSGGGSSGAVFGPTAVGAPAANPPVLVGGTVDGTATGTMSAWKVLAGVGFINCANCSGAGISVAYTGPIGTVGTPGGFKDASNNFQAFLGDTANGQWVSVKASVLPTGAATQTTLAAIQTALGSPFQAGGAIANTAFGISGTLPAFAATPTFNFGTLNGAATASLQTSGNASLSSMDTKTPALGQALAAGSVPIVLTAAQLTTLTPPAAITGFALDTTVQTTNSDLGPPGATVCATDTGSCSLNALLQRNNARSTSIITALGSPFQAGGSIGNTAFGISGTLPAYAATPTFNLGTLNGAATAANQTSVIGSASGGTAATNALLAAGQFNSSPITLTTTQQAALQVDASGFLKVNVAAGGASGGTSSTFGATFPGTGTAAGMSQAGNMVALTGTSGNLNVQCANCSGSGASAVDEATVTFGTSVFAPIGGAYQTTATSNPLVSGQQGLAQLTINRALHVNLRTAVGTIMGDATTPMQVSLANTGANATALLTTGTGGTFPVTQATASNLNATVVGTGTFAVQATIATASAWGINTLGSTTSGQSGQLGLCAVTTAAPTYTTAQSNALSCDTAGGLRVGGTVAFSNSTIAVTNAGTFAVQATQSGNWTSRTVGNAGAILDFAGQNASSPANAFLMGGQFNTSPTTITSGNASPLQLDSAGNLLVNIKAGASSGAVAQGSTTSGQTGGLTQLAVTTAAPTYTTATTNPLSGTVAGELRVFDAQVLAAINGPIPQVTAPLNAATAVATNSLITGGQYLSTQPTMTNTQQAGHLLSARGELLVAPGTSGFPVTISGNQAVNVAQIGGTTVDTGSGNMSAGTIRVALALNSPGILTPGQAMMSASAPVVIASDQSPIQTISVPSSSSAVAISHANTTALGTSLVAKASAGNLYAFNCTAITGGVAGYCIAYNATAAPSTGALTGSLVLDFCYYDATARGCSLSHLNYGSQHSAGIVILVTSAVTPYTYTTGTNTAAVTADYK